MAPHFNLSTAPYRPNSESDIEKTHNICRMLHFCARKYVPQTEGMISHLRASRRALHFGRLVQSRTMKVVEPPFDFRQVRLAAVHVHRTPSRPFSDAKCSRKEWVPSPVRFTYPDVERQVLENVIDSEWSSALQCKYQSPKGGIVYLYMESALKQTGSTIEWPENARGYHDQC